MSPNFRDKVHFKITGIEGQSNKGLVLQKKMLLKLRDHAHFHFTGIGGHTIKKPDGFSKKDVTEL